MPILTGNNPWGFIKGLGGSVSGAKGAFKAGMNGSTFRSLLKGTWQGGKGVMGSRAMALGAAVGVLPGALWGGRDHRTSGAVKGALLGAGAGFGGALAYNNPKGLKSMWGAARSKHGSASQWAEALGTAAK